MSDYGAEPIILFVYDKEMNLVNMVSNYTSLIWQEDYYGLGSFYIECVDTSDNINVFKQGYYVARKGKNTAMVIRYIKKISNENTIIVRGFTTNELLNQRTLWGTKIVNNVEQGIYDIVNSSIRGLPYFYTSTAKGFTEKFETQFTGTNVFEALVTLCEESKLGFYTEFDYRNKRHVFTVYKGKDLSYGNPYNLWKTFSPDFKNLIGSDIVNDDTIFRNVAFVAGEGEGAGRKWIEVNPFGAVGLERFELFVDARDLQKSVYADGNEIFYTDAQYNQMLYSRGVEKLNQHNKINTFIGEVNPDGFGESFYLGDIITCKSTKYGVKMDTRILSYNEVREQGKTSLHLTLGEPEISFKKAVMIWQR